MRAVKANITRGLQQGSIVNVADNSGGQRAKIIAVKGRKSSQQRKETAGIADIVKVSVKKGSPEVKKQEFPAIVVRQRKKFKRANGTRIHFEDNAVILMADVDLMEPKGTQIKGPIAKEVIQRFPSIGKISSIIA